MNSELYAVDAPTDKDDTFNKNCTQITASTEEIKRRISAFCEHKRSEINEKNRREYCNVFTQHSNSCARTDSVFVPRAGCIGHVKVSRVTNTHGPQTAQINPADTSTATETTTAFAPSQDAVEERLHNIESHLNLSGDLAQSDVHSRLKALEEKILRLESLSPEYFSSLPQPKRQRTTNQPKQEPDSPYRRKRKDDEDLSLAEIDEQMKVLREKLQSRMS